MPSGLRRLKWWLESIVDRWAVAWLDRYATPVELAGPSFYDGFYEEDEDPAKIRRAWALSSKGLTGPPRSIDVSSLNLSTIVFRDNVIREAE